MTGHYKHKSLNICIICFILFFGSGKKKGVDISKSYHVHEAM